VTVPTETNATTTVRALVSVGTATSQPREARPGGSERPKELLIRVFRVISGLSFFVSLRLLRCFVFEIR
jgi:hypothetical protein